jgi:hypothetical protein
MMDMDNILKATVFGTGGVIVGGLYSLVGYSQPSTENMGHRLSVQYKFCQRDEPILQLLESIEEEVVKLDKVAFVRTVLSIDDLIRLRYSVTPHSSKDRVDGMVTFQCAKQAIQRFIIRGEESNLSPRQLIYLQRKATKLITLMETHLQVIIMVTRD